MERFVSRYVHKSVVGFPPTTFNLLIVFDYILRSRKKASCQSLKNSYDRQIAADLPADKFFH